MKGKIRDFTIHFRTKFAESPTEEQKKMVNPVRKDTALNATLFKMNIIHFYHPRHKWPGFLTG